MQSDYRNIYQDARRTAGLTQERWAELLGICVKTLDGLIRRGQLPASKIGPRIVRIDERDLDAYVAGRLVAPMKKAAEPPKRPCRYYPGMRVV